MRAAACFPQVHYLPPVKFKPVERVLWAKWSTEAPPFIRKQERRTGRRALGVAYERKVQGYLQELYGNEYIASPWLHFQEPGGPLRWCQPDGILIRADEGIITCIEVKYQHTVDAWWQLWRLYVPVLLALFPPSLWAMHVCEVVKWFDPSTAFPQRPHMTPQLLDTRVGAFNVHIWHP